ncbi:hypothetical protein PTKIN_Ptkin02bG0027600 [Pterospermum kingtungense]
MIGKGVMRGVSLPKSCSWKKRLKSCNMKGKFGNFVLIDDDGDGCGSVIIIDGPESVGDDLEGSSGSKEREQFPSSGVISIDDDDDETDNMDDDEIYVECGELDSDASSSKSCPAPDFTRKSEGLDDDECQFVREKKSAFKQSKCKKTYAGKTPCGKRFGLSPESEDGSFESDSSDSEIVVGSVGKLREQWEKAFQRKKYNFRSGQSGLEDQTSASGSRSGSPPGADEENRTQQHAETPTSFGTSDSNIQKQDSSAFKANSNNYSRGSCLNRGTESPFVQPEKQANDESFSKSKYGRTAEEQFFHVHSDAVFEGETFMGNPPLDVDLEFSQASSNCGPYPSDSQHGRMGSNGKEKVQSKEPLMPIPKLSEVKQVNDDVSPSDVDVGTVFNKSTSVKPLAGIAVVSGKSYCDREKVVSGSNSHCDETQIKQSCTEVEQPSINSVATCKRFDERNTLLVQGVDATAACEADMVIDREKLKETNEYKRVMEEEWASRKRELQIQAEEAQRLRKRKKAESLRLLDMKRRQEQRLEEMREIQKKDEENMNLKEQLRSEVRKELIELEKSCINMASLLRSLGIPVGGGFCPLSNEVNAAYKRALLRFHPDRASKTDIRQQVEAEEKFKLITRMKEKFFLTSFR